MRSYRIIVDYTTTSGYTDRPDKWDWHTLLAEGIRETVSLVDVKEIETPAGHVEYFKELGDDV